jgi:hypothetical protein
MDSSLSVVLHRATTEVAQQQIPALGTWAENLKIGASMWFTSCIGSRKPARQHDTSTPADNTIALPSREKTEAAAQIPTPRLPQHAAASFLKTGTSRAMREANNIL